MLNLGKIIKKGLINKQHVIDIIQNHYLHHLVFPGVTLNKKKKEITLYSHAPIDIAIISRLAEDLNIQFNDNNLQSLYQSLNNINYKLQTWIQNNQFISHYRELNKKHKETNSDSPIKQILWNRNYTILNRTHSPQNRPYTVLFVHGHDSDSHIFNLDNLFGKGQKHHHGPYAIYITH